MSNENLCAAKRIKNDEFYTQYEDIENELYHYKNHFKDQVVFLNCDDNERSNFWLYFKNNFSKLGIKKLIATHYGEDAYKIELDAAGNIEKTPLTGDGSFQSLECIEILKLAGIVVTNPPFSLFKEFVMMLMRYNKKFLILGNKNAITYKEVFPHIKDNKIWLGYTSPKFFITPDGEMTKKLAGLTRWFTNLEHDKRNNALILNQDLCGDQFVFYDNYAAKDVPKVNMIPTDYKGIMGVPITFLDKHCPDQFEIVGTTESEGCGFSNGLWDELSKIKQPLIRGKKQYKRLFIKRKI